MPKPANSIFVDSFAWWIELAYQFDSIYRVRGCPSILYSIEPAKRSGDRSRNQKVSKQKQQSYRANWYYVVIGLTNADRVPVHIRFGWRNSQWMVLRTGREEQIYCPLSYKFSRQRLEVFVHSDNWQVALNRPLLTNCLTFHSFIHLSFEYLAFTYQNTFSISSFHK